MTYNFNQEIEYIDGTYDVNFNNAQKWAFEHNTTFKEDESKRKEFTDKKTNLKGLKRYFLIGEKPIIEQQIPVSEHIVTEEELKSLKRMERMNILGFICNDIERYKNQKEAGIPTTDSAEEYMNMLLYAQYLRDFCNQESEWWNESIQTFSEWKEKKK